MRKCFILIFGLFLFVIFSPKVPAQLIRLGLGGGLTEITTPEVFKGSIENADYGFKDNYHFTILAKFNIPMSPVKPAAFMDYYIFRGDGKYKDTSVSTSLSILSFGAEGEYYFLPIPFAKPYVLVDLQYNSFSQLQLNIGENSYVQLNHSSIGGAIGLGAEFALLPKVDIDLSVKYNIFNLTGRESGQEVVRALNVNLVLLF